MSNLERLKIELNNKDYFNFMELEQFLKENNLDSNEKYSKENNQAQLLQTVIDILESLMNNVDYFRQIQTEFTTTTAAYSYLKDRIDQLERKILTIQAESDTNASNVIFMYHT